jgi:hypothetical protein
VTLANHKCSSRNFLEDAGGERGRVVKKSKVDGVSLIKVYYILATNTTVKLLCTINFC